MHKATLFTCLLFLICQNAWGQDTLIKRNGQQVIAKVLKINPADIEYKRSDNLDGPLMIIPKIEVASINYLNGTKDEFPLPDTSAVSYNNYNNNISLTERAKIDAKTNYHNYHAAKNLTGITTALWSPLYGLIPAIACSSTPPAARTLNCPYPDLMENEEYRIAYTHKAYQIKKQQTWRGFGTGSAIYAGVVLVFLGLFISVHHVQ